MAFIGRQSGNIGNYVRCNTITPDGSTTTFALTNVLDNTAIAPGTENQIAVTPTLMSTSANAMAR